MVTSFTLVLNRNRIRSISEYAKSDNRSNWEHFRLSHWLKSEPFLYSIIYNNYKQMHWSYEILLRFLHKPQIWILTLIHFLISPCRSPSSSCRPLRTASSLFSKETHRLWQMKPSSMQFRAILRWVSLQQ